MLYALRYESLERYPDIVNTKIYSLNPATKEERLVFSDENTAILLRYKGGMPGYPGEVLAASRKRLFAYAVDKTLKPGRWYSGKASIYELSIDGSNNFRKVLDVMGEQSLTRIFVTASGNKIGYINPLGSKRFIWIHHTGSGNLANKIEVEPIFLDCFATNIDWMQDEERLFVSLDTGDEHVTSKESYQRVGTYIIREDGTHLMKLPAISFPPRKGFGPHPATPVFVGETPSGRYLLKGYRFKKGYQGTEASSFLYLLDPIARFKEEIPLKRSEGLNWFHLSHHGTYLVFIERTYQHDVSDLWIKALDSGREERVFSLPNHQSKEYYLGVVGWMNVMEGRSGAKDRP